MTLPHMPPPFPRRRTLLGAAAALVLSLAGGCGSPSQANIDLRKQNQQLQDQVNDLQRRHQADEATIRGLKALATTVPVLPESQIDQLFTTAGLQFGRLTGGYRPDLNLPADTMLKVYVVPVDGAGNVLKSAGTFRVELFDLVQSPYRIGDWNFDLQTAKADWNGMALLYTYVLDCPWQTPPQHAKLLARVTFTDALTHRIFTVDQPVTVQLAQ